MKMKTLIHTALAAIALATTTPAFGHDTGDKVSKSRRSRTFPANR